MAAAASAEISMSPQLAQFKEEDELPPRLICKVCIINLHTCTNVGFLKQINLARSRLGLLSLYTSELSLQPSVTTTLCWPPPSDTHSSHNSPARAGGETCEDGKQRRRPRCSSASSRLRLFVVTLIRNQASSHIRSRSL